MDWKKFNLTKNEFIYIINDKRFMLPLNWEGNDYIEFVEKIYNKYLDNCKIILDVEYYKDVKKICSKLIAVLNEYFLGLPSKAFKIFDEVMQFYFNNTELNLYKEGLKTFPYDKDINLYRMTKVEKGEKCSKERIFHVPYTIREKISSNRYSIAGFPALYLGTKVELCNKEIGRSKKNDRYVVRFNTCFNHEIIINVFDLAIRPSDFIFRFDTKAEDYATKKLLMEVDERTKINKKNYKRFIDAKLLDTANIRGNYVIWYPLIAICSCIRQNKKASFSVEYIIPQMLMQWIRITVDELNQNDSNKNLIAIRYFSSASINASNGGFNYVFPTSGERYQGRPYCNLLASLFKLNTPINEKNYKTLHDCEKALLKDNNFSNI